MEHNEQRMSNLMNISLIAVSNGCLYWQSYKTIKHTEWAKCRFFNVKMCLQTMYRYNCTLNVNHMPAFAHCLFHHASNVADVAEQQMWHGVADDETTWNIPEFFTGWGRGC
jgi:hypothetical protein